MIVTMQQTAEVTASPSEKGDFILRTLRSRWSEFL